MPPVQVSRPVKLCFLLTDIGFLLYWGASLLMALGVPLVDPRAMYYGYGDPLIFAWNWSFFPLDALLAVLGLSGLYLARDPLRRTILLVASAALTFCAGLMALSFWTVTQAFDPLWWGLNAFLCLWPAMFLGSALRRGATGPGPKAKDTG